MSGGAGSSPGVVDEEVLERLGQVEGSSRSPGGEEQAELSEELWTVVTCKGRLSHLKKSLPRMLSFLPGRVCVVDYGCPQKAGDWCESNQPEALGGGRLLVLRAAEYEIDTQFFNRARANNLGARVCIERGATGLLFLDADTLVLSPLAAHLARVQEGRFFIASRAPDGGPTPSLTGVLGVSVADWRRVTGYDEWFDCWGSEDIDMRVRLFFQGACRFEVFPFGSLHALPHSNTLRILYSRERNLRRGAARNQNRVREWVTAWTGGDWNAWQRELEYLWFL